MSASASIQVAKLLDRLTHRARQCPGLSPLSTEDEFMALACWQAGSSDSAAVASALSHLWHYPADASAWVNRLLLETQPPPALGPVSSTPSDPAWRSALRAAFMAVRDRQAA